jgi:hypothetical protein
VLTSLPSKLPVLIPPSSAVPTSSPGPRAATEDAVPVVVEVAHDDALVREPQRGELVPALELGRQLERGDLRGAL